MTRHLKKFPNLRYNDVATRNRYGEHDTINMRDSSVNDLRSIRGNPTSFPVDQNMFSTSREIHGNTKEMISIPSACTSVFADKDFVKKEKYFILPEARRHLLKQRLDRLKQELDLLDQTLDLLDQTMDLLKQELDPPKQELNSRIINIDTKSDELDDICRKIRQFMKEIGHLLSEIAESLSVNNGVHLLDVDIYRACILIIKRSLSLAYRMIRKASTSDVIQQSIVSQLSPALHPFGGYGFDEGDENSTVLNIFALLARRKSVLHSRYWLITEELFTNAIRQIIRVTDLYYTVIYPIDSRMNIYLPGFRGGFFNVKDINHLFCPNNTNNATSESK